MAPRTSAAPAAPTPVVAIPMTTVHGFAIQMLAFVPIPKDDLKKQVEVSQLLIDIKEGTKSPADLFPHMKGIEFRQQHVGKRVTVEEANSWRTHPTLALVPADEGQGDEGSNGGEEDNTDED